MIVSGIFERAVEAEQGNAGGLLGSHRNKMAEHKVMYRLGVPEVTGATRWEAYFTVKH